MKGSEEMLYNNFLAELIETVEDFLEEKGVLIPNDEKLGDGGESAIYGTDYGNLMQAFRETCRANGIEVRDSWKV
jgi:hypothetical protein